MKNLDKEEIVMIVFGALIFTTIFTITYCMHRENVKMIEAGYVKQPEQWVKP